MKRKSETIEDGRSLKISKLTSFGAEFRRILKTDNGINALNDFVFASKNRNVVTEYINSGGSAKELVSLLKKFDGKKDFIVSSSVFAALQLVIVKAIDDLLLIQKNVEEACEELLCSYHVTMQNMLCSSSSSTSFKKTVLKLLTSMVTLSASLAKKILTLFPINSKLLKTLIDLRASNSAVQLRISFIHYLISFLIDENTVLITQLLKMKGLLSSIVHGLINDKLETVVLVLNTFRLKIVENVEISKTLKIHTFNTPVLRSLFKLYDYKRENDSKNDVDSSDSNQSVRSAVHSLLMLLCTSLKKGILFRERGLQSGKSQNQLILTLLEDIDGPWKDELKSQLVTEVLKVCPEFLKTVYSQLESSLQPDNSENWKKLMLFLKEIVEKQELSPEIIKEQTLFNTITFSFFPTVVQKLLRDHCDNEIVHQSRTVTFYILSLLEVCLSKISIFLKQCLLSVVDQSTFNALTDHVEQFLNRNSISCVILINTWNCSLDVSDDQFSDISNYYDSLANVLLLHNRLCPISFQQLHLHEEISLKEIDLCNSELKFKRAQLMYFILQPKPNHDQFSSLLRQLICSCIEDGEETRIRFLEDVFLNTGFFEGFENEILIWMYCVKKSPTEYSVVISDLLVDVFAITSKKYLNFLADITSVACENEVLLFKTSDLTADIEYFVGIDEVLERTCKPTVLISPVIPALLSVLKSFEKSNEKRLHIDLIKTFVLRLFVHLLHLQSNSCGLIALLKKYSSCYIDAKLLEYVHFWSDDKLKIKLFQYPLSDEETAAQLSTVLMKSKHASPLYSDTTDLEYILLWNLCLFYSSQLNNKHLLDNKRFDRLKITFLLLREKLSLESKTHCIKLVISDLNYINNFNLAEEIPRNSLFILLLEICRNFQEHNSLPSNYSKLLSPYRQRLILFLLSKQQQNKSIDFRVEGNTIDQIIHFVKLNDRTSALLLNKFSTLSNKLLVTNKGKELSEWCAVIQSLLGITAKNLLHPIGNECLLILLDKIQALLTFGVNVDCLENSIINYFQSFPHHINIIRPEAEEIITNLIDHNLSVDKLAVYLFPYYPSVDSVLMKKIAICGENMDINELFETAIKIAPAGSDHHILEIIGSHHYPSLISWIDSDCVWEMKYAVLVSKIFQRYIDVKMCSHLCNKIENEWPTKRLNAETCSVMNVIFKNAGKTEKFVSLLVSSLINVLLSSCENVNWLSSSLYEIVQSVVNFNFMVTQDVWTNFVKSALKISLQTCNATLMRTLRLICEKALTSDHTVETSTIFQMTISHSEFVNLILGNSEIKCELVEFYLLLTTKNVSLMSSNHVPLLLSAYKGLLSKSDQLLLQVLHWYEANKIRFRDCKPYLWGDAAVAHYSIRTEISVSLKRQPQPNQVLELLDIEIVKNTIRCARLDRALQPGEQIHCVSVDVYDLSFMLPLMSHLLAPESRVSVQKFTRSGALAMVLVALSSQKEDIRMAAFHCLQRFQSHLNSREKEIQIWDHFINSLRNGILSAQFNYSDDNTPPTLPCIVTNFLAHMSLIISEPLHSLYVPLTNFLLAKPSFDVNTIPDFLALFYSADLQNRNHQEWILRIIKDGMRSELDWITAQRCFLFKLILQYYSSASSNEATNVLVLEILNNALKIPSCKAYLVSKFGLLSWLNQIVQNRSDFNKNVLLSLIGIFQSLKSAKSCSNLIFIILVLLRKLHLKNIDLQFVENLLEILSVLYSCDKKTVLRRIDIEFIIDFAMPYHNPQDDQLCRNCIIYSSVVGIHKCNSNITNYVILMIQKFLNHK